MAKQFASTENRVMKGEYLRQAFTIQQRMVGLLGMAALLLMTSRGAALAAGQGPLDLVKQTTEGLFSAVRDQRQAIDADPGVARALVRKLVTPHVDLERTSRWVLGKYWRKASATQREAFTQQFRTLLVRTYATAVTDYADLEMTYLPLKGDVAKDDVTIKTQLPQKGGQPIDIYYRMHRTDDTWKVYDVTIAGVSLVTTYRSSFAAEVRKGGIDGLIKRLAEKNRT